MLLNSKMLKNFFFKFLKIFFQNFLLNLFQCIALNRKEMNQENLKSLVAIIQERSKGNERSAKDVIGSMNEIQSFLIPQNMSIFLPELHNIFLALFKIMDDTDVSIRHNAIVVLNSIATLILPFQKSSILSFISEHINDNFNDHALIVMIELELKVSLFLIPKVCQELFFESAPLFLSCAASSSEIVSEQFNNLAASIRPFFNNQEQRLKLIQNLSKIKTSILSTRWSTNSAAIFSYPDLIDQTVPLFESPILYLSYLLPLFPPDDLSIYSKYQSVFDNATIEELLPFISRNPTNFFSILKSPPPNSSPRELCSFLNAVEICIPYGYEISFPIEVITNFSSDNMVYGHQINCYAMLALREKFSRENIFNVFYDALDPINKSRNTYAISAFSLVFNHYPSTKLFEKILNLPTSSPALCRALIQFLTEIDFGLLDNIQPKFKEKSIQKLVEISHSKHELVQKELSERCIFFNNGNTTLLFSKLFSELDVFEPSSFRNCISLLACLANDKCQDLISTLFLILQDCDESILWGDATGLITIMKSIEKICKNCSHIKIPKFIQELPLLTLRAVIGFLQGEFLINSTKIDQNSQSDFIRIPSTNDNAFKAYNHLLSKFATQKFSVLFSALQKLPLTTLLQIRDIAISCISGILLHSKLCDLKTLDLLGKKLIPWPSALTWKLLSISAKAFCNTTGGFLSVDENIVLAAALECPDKFSDEFVKDSSKLRALSMFLKSESQIDEMFQNFADNEITLDFIQTMDYLVFTHKVNFPTWFIAKITNPNQIWKVIGFKYNLSNNPIIQYFLNLDFSQWHGPILFWELLPQFILKLIKNGQLQKINIQQNLDAMHLFFSRQNSRLFFHNQSSNCEEYSTPSNTSVETLSTFTYPQLFDLESIRSIRNFYYGKMNCSSFKELIMASNRSIQIKEGLLESIVEFLTSEECQNDPSSIYDAVCLSLELIILGKLKNGINNKGIILNTIPLLQWYLLQPSFRGIGGQYAEFTQMNKFGIPQMQIPIPSNEPIVLESEMNRLIPIYLRSGNKIAFQIKPRSHISKEIIHSISQRTFSICSRYDLAPDLNKENEDKMRRYIKHFGLTKFSLVTLDNWIGENDLIPLIKAALTFIIHNGTYHTKEFVHFLQEAMLLHPLVRPVVEAFLLTADQSPFRIQLESAFLSVNPKQEK